ncbi:unnamed protein product [Cuscuta europaea]|uniref:Uncharacterized protein n=1 Tax=Cuscuta europaea TaxID=41803 RepID=A0A9P0ZTV5_CUSEU|nr:unnamed protein product [Cuscuta europaea]
MLFLLYPLPPPRENDAGLPEFQNNYSGMFDGLDKEFHDNGKIGLNAPTIRGKEGIKCTVADREWLTDRELLGNMIVE